MKANALSAHGAANVLKIAELPNPKPEKNIVVVKLFYAGLNHVDIWVRQGNPAYHVSLPHILGADGAGIVEAIGDDVEGVSIGDRVVICPSISCGECVFCKRGRDNQCDSFEILGAKRNGTYAEYVAIPDDNVIVLPDSIPYETAAAYPLAYLTAWHMLVSRAQMKRGESILIVGASAGVSIAAIQIAKMIGVTVYASTTDASKISKIKSVGADFVLNSSENPHLSKWVIKETGGKGVDVAFEHVGPITWEHSVKSLARYGRLVTCGATTGPVAQLDLRYVFSRDLSILGARMGTKQEFQDLSSAIFCGKINPVIDTIFELENADEAHSYMEERKQIGKILLKIS